MRDGAKMTARLILRDQVHEVRAGSTIRHALQKLGIAPETVLPTRDGELLTDDELLREEDTIRLIAVISGGTLVG
jgi:sulfur carrier protein ThiS